MNSVPVANYLAVAYIFWVVLGSLSSDAWNTPCLFIFCDKFNFFNQYFVKLCWGWTFFTCLTSSSVKLWRQIIDNKHYCKVWLHFIAGTVIWFVGTRSIDFIKDSYGICELDGDKMAFNLNKQNCKSSLKGQWLPYLDISGHIFMMVFCCLIIAYDEESFNWSKENSKSITSPGNTFNYSGEGKEADHIDSENCVLPDRLLRVMDVFASGIILVLFGIFNLMLIMTTLYFHTPIEKVLGVAMGVCSYNLISFKYPWDCLSKFQPV